MKPKTTKKRLAVKKERLRSLATTQLAAIQGGNDWAPDGVIGLIDTRCCATTR